MKMVGECRVVWAACADACRALGEGCLAARGCRAEGPRESDAVGAPWHEVSLCHCAVPGPMCACSQADNEQERLAIIALRECLRIQPENQTAGIALAVSFTNEVGRHPHAPLLDAPGRLSLGIRCAREHAAQQPSVSRQTATPSAARKGSRLVRSHQCYCSSLNYFSFTMSSNRQDNLRNMYIEAAQLSPDNLDPDLQIGLGVLFNIRSICAFACSSPQPAAVTMTRPLTASLLRWACGMQCRRVVYA